MRRAFHLLSELPSLGTLSRSPGLPTCTNPIRGTLKNPQHFSKSREIFPVLAACPLSNALITRIPADEVRRATLWKCCCVCRYYYYCSGREAASLKMGSVCFSHYCCGGRLPVFMLVGWRAANNHILCSRVKYSWADDMV